MSPSTAPTVDAAADTRRSRITPIRSVARRTSSGLCEERGGELTSLIQTIRSRRWYAAASRTPATPAAPAVGW